MTKADLQGDALAPIGVKKGKGTVGGSWIPPINERSSVGDIFIDLIRNEDKCELTIAGSDDAGVGVPTWP